MNWYKIICKDRHYGTRSDQDQVIYVWESSPIDALNKYKKLGGVPRSTVPSILNLNPEEEKNLEFIIRETKRNLQACKRTFVRIYGIQKYRNIGMKNSTSGYSKLE